MRDLGVLILRLVLGTIMMGHGSQKLFGWFGGPGIKGVEGMMESLEVRPASIWARVSSLGEAGGGLLTVLGFLSPLGPLNIAAGMLVAMRKVHWNKGFWNSAGGIEFPLVNFGAGIALALIGPGAYSLDRRLGTRLPGPLVALVWLITAATTAAALRKPEMAAAVIDKAMAMLPGVQPVPGQPDLQVETRPTPNQQTSRV